MTTPVNGSWQPNPDGSGDLRWWDGSNWTERTQPIDGRSETHAPQQDRAGGPPKFVRGDPASVDHARPEIPAPQPIVSPIADHPESIAGLIETPPAATTHEMVAPPPAAGPADAGPPNPPGPSENPLNPQDSVGVPPGILIGGTLVALLLLGGCIALVSSALKGPSTRVELCQAHREMTERLLDSSSIFNSEFFDRLDDLADVAKRYEDSPSVQRAGERLADLADGDGGFIVTINGFELLTAVAPIEAECF